MGSGTISSTAINAAGAIAGIEAFERARRLWLIAEYDRRQDISLADLVIELSRREARAK